MASAAETAAEWRSLVACTATSKGGGLDLDQREVYLDDDP
jgi:hypothetical protein